MGSQGVVLGFLGRASRRSFGIACAKCEFAKPLEPIAPRFELCDDAVLRATH